MARMILAFFIWIFMKTKIFLSLIIAASLTFYFTSKNKSPNNNQQSTSSKADISSQESDVNSKKVDSESKNDLSGQMANQDMDQLKPIIEKSSKDNEFNEAVVDFSMDPREILEKISPTVIYQNSKSIINNLSACIDNHCGMKPDTDGYFDPENTVEQKLINRNLELLLLVSTEGNLFEFNINDVDFEKIFKGQNKKMIKNALKLYLSYYKDEASIVKLFDYSINFKDELKANFYSQISEATSQSPDLRAVYLSAIESDFKNSSGLERVELIKNIKLYNLDREEIKPTLTSLCSETNDKILNIVKVSLDEINDPNYSFNNICN